MRWKERVKKNSEIFKTYLNKTRKTSGTLKCTYDIFAKDLLLFFYEIRFHEEQIQF